MVTAAEVAVILFISQLNFCHGEEQKNPPTRGGSSELLLTELNILTILISLHRS